MAMQDIRVTIGFRAQVNGALELSIGAGDGDGHRRQPARRHPRDGHQDRRSTSRRCRTSRRRATPGSCSSGRPASPWTAPTSAATSRASSRATSRAARRPATTSGRSTASTSPTWPPPAPRPIYYDFDMLEEMQVTTGGADVTQQTGGVGINLVTKSGTDRFKGSRPLLRDRREVRGRQHHRRAARRRAPAPARRSRTSRTTASTSAVRS